MEFEYSSVRTHKEYKRFCKTLTLKDDPELIREYKKVHAKGAAWPEITKGMEEAGILDMEIYLSGTNLFMIMDTKTDFDHEKAMKELALKPRQAEWEAYVSKFQKASSDESADEKWQLVERIFKLGE
jgi:L-rhamnose mutarotase